MFFRSNESINFPLRIDIESGGTVTQEYLCKRKFAGRVLTIKGALPIILIDSLSVKVLEDQIIICLLQRDILTRKVRAGKWIVMIRPM